MDLPTYTNIWRIEKRLYKLYDFRLPAPVPVNTAGIALASLFVWCVLLMLLRVPFEFGNGWHLVLWVLPPGLVAVAATRPVAESKRLGELAHSQVRYLREARVYVRLRPEYEPAHLHVSATVWHRPQAPDRRQIPARPRRHMPTMPLPHAITPHPAQSAPEPQASTTAPAAA